MTSDLDTIIQQPDMAHILDLPTEIIRLILEELYLQGYQFNSVINVCQRWRQIVLDTVFRGRGQRWVYSQNHGCLVVYRGTDETSRIRRQPGCLVRYGTVPLRVYHWAREDGERRVWQVTFSGLWGHRRVDEGKIPPPSRINATAFPEYRDQGPGIWPHS